SSRNRLFRSTTRKQIAPAAKPIRSEAAGPTKPDAGVMATSPATAPVTAPTVVALPWRIHSGISQPSIAAAAPHRVGTTALAGSPPADRALPALNPNQPNHRIAAPSTTMGTLCG